MYVFTDTIMLKSIYTLEHVNVDILEQPDYPDT